MVKGWIFSVFDKPGQAEEPCRGSKVGAADDALGHQELCAVDDEPGEVTEEEHDDNANKNAGKIHLIVGAAVVAVWANMGISVIKIDIKGK